VTYLADLAIFGTQHRKNLAYTTIVLPTSDKYFILRFGISQSSVTIVLKWGGRNYSRLRQVSK